MPISSFSGRTAGVRFGAFNGSATSDLLKRLVAKKELPFGDQDADARWGKAGTFNLLSSDLGSQPGFTVIWPPEEEPPEEEPPPIQYDEESREEEEVRVENPDDAEQYVIVARVTSMILRRRDDQTRIQLNFNPPR